MYDVAKVQPRKELHYNASMLRLRPIGSRVKNSTKAATASSTSTSATATATINRQLQKKHRKYRNLNRHRRKNRSTSQHHHVFIVCGLIIVTIVEIIYLFYNGREGKQEGFLSHSSLSILRRAKKVLNEVLSGKKGRSKKSAKVSSRPRRLYTVAPKAPIWLKGRGIKALLVFFL